MASMTHRMPRGPRPSLLDLDRLHRRTRKHQPEVRATTPEWRAYLLELQRAQPWTRWRHNRQIRRVRRSI